MSFGSFVTAYCYPSSFDWNGYVTWFFYTTPITVWWLLTGLAFYSRDCYIQLLSSSFWISAIVSFLLQELIRATHSNACNNQGLSNPSWETQIAWHFVIMMMCHRLLWIGAIGTWDILRGVYIAVFIPIWLVVSGNYTVAEVLIGAAVGIVVGAFTVQAIFLFWVDRLQIITTHPLLMRWGYLDNVPFFFRDTSESRVQPGSAKLLDPFMSAMDSTELEQASRLRYPLRRPRVVPAIQRFAIPRCNEENPQVPVQDRVPTKPALIAWDQAADLIATALLGGGTLANREVPTG